ncbi:hypothetical protein MIB92_17105 [Aestuariirhabdus sp. Z084]|uniref:hypothetical protein n=1 Tax=Aestuariirhabdus haliotis TaxID=2918751 RepID=UPI00201B37B2|nr:hypothetical protein [Aestuariirhabdus haliotis]MCL6417381.1 hypothetical protein [Aestuariirhabdus haliotis]
MVEVLYTGTWPVWASDAVEYRIKIAVSCNPQIGLLSIPGKGNLGCHWPVSVV